MGATAASSSCRARGAGGDEHFEPLRLQVAPSASGPDAGGDHERLAGGRGVPYSKCFARSHTARNGNRGPSATKIGISFRQLMQ
jgi:hypothetical protein